MCLKLHGIQFFDKKKEKCKPEFIPQSSIICVSRAQCNIIERDYDVTFYAVTLNTAQH